MKLNLIFLSVLIFSISLYSSEKDTIPEGFVYLKDVNPDIIYDIRYYSTHNFVGDTIDGYYCGECILTKEAAMALDSIQKELMEFNLTLKVYDCYRPQRAVNHFVKWAKDISDTKTKKEFYPTVDKKNLFKDGYIAAKSSHSRGSTVDLTIVPIPVPEQEQYIEGMELHECFKPVDIRFGDNSVDMGTGFDCFHKHSHPKNEDVSFQSRINRLLLRTLMIKYGFKPYEFEWWHFTLDNEPYPETYYDFPVKR